MVAEDEISYLSKANAISTSTVPQYDDDGSVEPSDVEPGRIDNSVIIPYQTTEEEEIILPRGIRRLKMGRKKKKITNNTLGVGYSGKVKISLIKDNKALITKEYKNTGNWPMFYFLNLCLSGEYNKAEAYRPKYLKLFNAGESRYRPKHYRHRGDTCRS